jgi:predicted nucleotidyltransferase
MHPSIAQHRDEIADLCRRFGVSRLEAFGSAARAVDFDPANSDADFLVEFEVRPDLTALRQYFGFAEALQDLLGRRVDLVNGEIRNPYVQATIDKDRELIFVT